MRQQREQLELGACRPADSVKPEPAQSDDDVRHEARRVARDERIVLADADADG